jgi:hypothetical protein
VKSVGGGLWIHVRVRDFVGDLGRGEFGLSFCSILLSEIMHIGVAVVDGFEECVPVSWRGLAGVCIWKGARLAKEKGVGPLRVTNFYNVRQVEENAFDVIIGRKTNSF